MLVLLSSIALAGWTRTAEENGCVYSVGERQGTYAPVRAECEWPIAAGELQALVGELRAWAESH